MNKRNLLYFESKSMRDLYAQMDEWQREHDKRLLSTDIQRDGEKFCCIALSNPTEVVLCDSNGEALDTYRHPNQWPVLRVMQMKD